MSFSGFRRMRVPARVKILGLAAGIALLVGTSMVWPQAMNVLEQTAESVVRYFGTSEAELKRRFDAEEAQLDTLRERLHATDIDSLSPREALELLYELKREALD